jgi:adenylate cyclase
VGDEAIITWGRDAGSSGALEAFFSIGEAIAAREGYYRARYGDVPRFRAGLHFGKLVVGEMGDYKQEIALLGDVMKRRRASRASVASLGPTFSCPRTRRAPWRATIAPSSRAGR